MTDKRGPLGRVVPEVNVTQKKNTPGTFESLATRLGFDLIKGNNLDNEKKEDIIGYNNQTKDTEGAQVSRRNSVTFRHSQHYPLINPCPDDFEETMSKDADIAGFDALIETDLTRLFLTSADRFVDRWDVLKRYRGTVFPSVLKSPILKLTIFTYMFVVFVDLVFVNHSIPGFEFIFENKGSFFITAPASGVSAIGSLLTFFAVFYSSSCYARFFAIHANCCQCKRDILDAALACSAYLQGDANGRVGARIVRCLNASHLLGHIYLSKRAAKTNDTSAKKTFNEKNLLYPFNTIHRLLTPNETWEVEQLAKTNANLAWQAPVVWAMQAATQAKKDGQLTSDLGEETIVAAIMEYRRSMQGLYGKFSQPVPFMYYNLIAWLNWIYQPVAAYHLAVHFLKDSLSESNTTGRQVGVVCFGLFLTFAMAVGLLGLKVVAEKLSNPLGQDSADIITFTIINSTCKQSRWMLRETMPPPRPPPVPLQNEQSNLVDGFNDTEIDLTVQGEAMFIHAEVHWPEKFRKVEEERDISETFLNDIRLKAVKKAGAVWEKTQKIPSVIGATMSHRQQEDKNI